MIRVVVVEDIHNIREGLAAIFNATSGFSCPKTFSNYEDMLPEIKKINPDIILSDIGLPGISGIDGIKEIKKILTETKVIMLTVHEDSEKIIGAILAGAVGYLTKKTPPVKIIEAVEDAYKGGSPMNSEIASIVLSAIRTIHNDKIHSESFKLTYKEKSILELLSEGKNYKTIGNMLNISEHTVRYHIKHIYEKMHVSSQSEAIAKAFKSGLI